MSKLLIVFAFQKQYHILTLVINTLLLNAVMEKPIVKYRLLPFLWYNTNRTAVPDK